MALILGAARLLALVNSVLLAVGRHIAIWMMALMVVFILIQVFFRYALNNALPWPDEAARFMMLWLTGLVAPTAYRRGGFVAIDMVMLMFPKKIGAILSMVLLFIALMVLVTAVQIGWGEVTGFSGKFKTAAIKTVFIMKEADSFPWVAVEWGWQKMPRAQMMASLLVGVTLMAMVNVELILRQIVTLMGRDDELPVIPEAATLGAD